MSDLISRQDAIYAFEKELSAKYNKRELAIGFVGVKSILENLSSVQPEIIRCKDCKHRDPEDKKSDCGHDILWQLSRDYNWYCADAERREE